MLTFREWQRREVRRRVTRTRALVCFAGCVVIALIAWAVR